MKTALSALAGLAGLAALLVSTAPARAAPATIAVGGYAEPPPRYYAPPPPPPVIVSDSPPDPPAREYYRAPFRLGISMAGVTTGRSLGPGVGLALDFGRGSVGFRLAAAWTRGEPTGAGVPPSPITDGLAQYTGELTLDLHKPGPLHPVFGFGLGVARVSRGDGGGVLGVGTARAGLEYALGLDDADVRLHLSVLGALPGPSDRDISDVRAYALVGAGLLVGF